MGKFLHNYPIIIYFNIYFMLINYIPVHSCSNTDHTRNRPDPTPPFQHGPHPPQRHRGPDVLTSVPPPHITGKVVVVLLQPEQANPIIPPTKPLSPTQTAHPRRLFFLHHPVVRPASRSFACVIASKNRFSWG